jgi:hypothetical protein
LHVYYKKGTTTTYTIRQVNEALNYQRSAQYYDSLTASFSFFCVILRALEKSLFVSTKMRGVHTDGSVEFDEEKGIGVL